MPPMATHGTVISSLHQREDLGIGADAGGSLVVGREEGAEGDVVGAGLRRLPSPGGGSRGR